MVLLDNLACFCRELESYGLDLRRRVSLEALNVWLLEMPGRESREGRALRDNEQFPLLAQIWKQVDAGRYRGFWLTVELEVLWGWILEDPKENESQVKNVEGLMQAGGLGGSAQAEMGHLGE